MSQEYVEIGMRAVAAFNRRDVAAVLLFYPPDGELRDLTSFDRPGPRLQGYRRDP